MYSCSQGGGGGGWGAVHNKLWGCLSENNDFLKRVKHKKIWSDSRPYLYDKRQPISGTVRTVVILILRKM